MTVSLQHRLKMIPLPALAAMLLVGGISLLGLSDNLVRLVSDDVGLGMYHFLRSAISVALFLLLKAVFGFVLLPVRWGPALVRTFLISMAMALFFSVLSFLPVAVAGAGLFTSPVFVLIFSALFFGLRPGWRRLTAVIFGSAGVWLILQPDADNFHLIQLLPVCAGAFYALSSIVTRRYCADESPYALTAMYMVMLGAVGALWSVASDLLSLTSTAGQTAFFLRGLSWPDLPGLGWIALMAVLSVIGVCMITKAYQLAETSYMAVFEYSYLITAGIIGWLLWDDRFGAAAAAGIVLIVCAGVLVSLLPAKRQ